MLHSMQAAGSGCEQFIGLLLCCAALAIIQNQGLMHANRAVL